MRIGEGEIREVAESNRNMLPSEFFEYYNDIASALAEGCHPQQFRPRAASSNNWYSRIGPAVFNELFTLLCTKDKRYDDVRKSGDAVGKSAVAVIAGYIAGSCGIELGVATGSVAFAVLLVLKLSTRTFCRLMREQQT